MRHAERPMYGRELAQALHFPEPAVLGIVHRLETAGYLRLVDTPAAAPPQDRGGRPRRWFELTPEGQDFAAQIGPATEQMVTDQARSAGISISTPELAREM